MCLARGRIKELEEYIEESAYCLLGARYVETYKYPAPSDVVIRNELWFSVLKEFEFRIKHKFKNFLISEETFNDSGWSRVKISLVRKYAEKMIKEYADKIDKNDLLVLLKEYTEEILDIKNVTYETAKKYDPQFNSDDKSARVYIDEVIKKYALKLFNWYYPVIYQECIDRMIKIKKYAGTL